MKDTTISLQFCFRGETFTPTLLIDMGEWLSRGAHPEALYHLLAESLGCGPYSYEYDVLMMREIEFSPEKAWIQKHIDHGKLNITACHSEWQEQQILNIVLPIAEKHLSHALLNEHPSIRDALVESYRSGQLNSNKMMINEEFRL